MLHHKSGLHRGPNIYQLCAGFPFCWQVLLFKEWNKLYLLSLNTQNYILFKIPAWGLFLKYSYKISEISVSIFLQNIFL